MVQRWHTGTRIGATATLTHSRRKLTQNHHPPTRLFHLGQPVSSQNFTNSYFRNNLLHRPIENDENNPIYNTTTATTTTNNNSNNNHYQLVQDVFNNGNIVNIQPVPTTSRNARSAFDERPTTTTTIPSPRLNEPPWSGESPPSKDRSLRGSSRDVPITPRIEQNLIRDNNLPTLSAPELFSQYNERFNRIQNKLGVVLESMNST